jgi:hypothetical protein
MALFQNMNTIVSLEYKSKINQKQFPEFLFYLKFGKKTIQIIYYLGFIALNIQIRHYQKNLKQHCRKDLNMILIISKY